MNRPLIAVTIGDPAGIGPEIVVRAAATEAVRQSAGLVIVGDRRIIERAMDVTRVRLRVGEDAGLIDPGQRPGGHYVGRDPARRRCGGGTVHRVRRAGSA